MNSLRSRLVTGLLLMTAVGGAGCKRDEPAPVRTLLFPTLAARQGELDKVQLTGAGSIALVTLRKHGGSWRVLERGDWPADGGRLSQYLFVLSQARGIEAKTANPALYSRLGVEPISDPSAKGTELELSGVGINARLLIGNEHAKFNSNYVRIDRQAQAWLTDLPVGFDRDPASWLDRRLVDLPLARIDTVQVSGGSEKPFSLSHRDDRFRLDDAPSAAMHDSYRGDALAGVLDQLKFDDLAADDNNAVIERELRFTAVDGTVVVLQAWHVNDRLWIRATALLDEARLHAWASLAGHAQTADAVRSHVAGWNKRFQGQRFCLSPDVAATLLLTHAEILAAATDAASP